MEEVMTIMELLEELDGAGIILEDPELVQETLAQMQDMVLVAKE